MLEGDDPRNNDPLGGYGGYGTDPGDTGGIGSAGPGAGPGSEDAQSSGGSVAGPAGPGAGPGSEAVGTTSSSPSSTGSTSSLGGISAGPVGPAGPGAGPGSENAGSALAGIGGPPQTSQSSGGFMSSDQMSNLASMNAQDRALIDSGSQIAQAYGIDLGAGIQASSIAGHLMDRHAMSPQQALGLTLHASRTLAGETEGLRPWEQAAAARTMLNRMDAFTALGIGGSMFNPHTMLSQYDANSLDNRTAAPNKMYQAAAPGTLAFAHGLTALSTAISPVSELTGAPPTLDYATHYYNPDYGIPKWGSPSDPRFGAHSFVNDRTMATQEQVAEARQMLDARMGIGTPSASPAWAFSGTAPGQPATDPTVANEFPQPLDPMQPGPFRYGVSPLNGVPMNAQPYSGSTLAAPYGGFGIPQGVQPGMASPVYPGSLQAVSPPSSRIADITAAIAASPILSGLAIQPASGSPVPAVSGGVPTIQGQTLAEYPNYQPPGPPLSALAGVPAQPIGAVPAGATYQPAGIQAAAYQPTGQASNLAAIDPAADMLTGVPSQSALASLPGQVINPSTAAPMSPVLAQPGTPGGTPTYMSPMEPTTEYMGQELSMQGPLQPGPPQTAPQWNDTGRIHMGYRNSFNPPSSDVPANNPVAPANNPDVPDINPEAAPGEDETVKVPDWMTSAVTDPIGTAKKAKQNVTDYLSDPNNREKVTQLVAAKLYGSGPTGEGVHQGQDLPPNPAAPPATDPNKNGKGPSLVDPNMPKWLRHMIRTLPPELAQILGANWMNMAETVDPRVHRAFNNSREKRAA